MSNIQDSIQKIPLKHIAQTPFAYCLYVITTVLLSVIFVQRYDARAERLEHAQETARHEAEMKEERKLKDDISKAYLAEHMANQAIQKAVDSTAIKNYKHEK